MAPKRKAVPPRLTGRDNYFEDFNVGDVYEHARGKTVGELENVLITNLVLNTAQLHFNEDFAASLGHKHRVIFGGVTVSLVVGLAMQDTGENALAELGLDRVRLRTPVMHGDTLYALSEVLAKSDFGPRSAGRPELAGLEPAEVGEVRFRHVGLNQEGRVVCEIERRVLIKRRSFKVAPNEAETDAREGVRVRRAVRARRSATVPRRSKRR